MSKTTDLLEKIRDTKGPFHAMISKIKDRNIKDLTEAEDVKKRWQENIELCQKKKCPNDPDKHNVEATDLEPDILECKVKWFSGSIFTNKPSTDDGILADLFKVLKDDAVKSPAPYSSQRWRSFIHSAKTRLGADCGSDHELHIAKFRLKLNKVGKPLDHSGMT